MLTCPNCGTANDATSRFCAQCGADLRAFPPQPQSQPQPPLLPPPGFAPPGYPPAYPPGAGYPPPTPQWPPPPEPPRGRRTWLWITIGLIAACLLLCCAFLVWGNTAGQGTMDNLLTRVSDELTEVAPTPTPLLRNSG